MFVACSTLCFARHPLDRALRTIAEMGFTKVEVAVHEHGPHLRPSQVATDPTPAFHLLRGGPGLSPAAFSLEIEAASDEEHARQLRAVCRLARLCMVPLVTVAAAPAAADLSREVERLTRAVKVASLEGTLLCVATRTGTLTETPDRAVELCQKVPGLGLTLDPSHYISGPHQGKSYDVVWPHVRHVHLRDTGRGPNQFQVRVGQGLIEYGRIVTQLSRCQYDRLLCVNVRDIPDAPFSMEGEVRKLKYLLESLV